MLPWRARAAVRPDRTVAGSGWWSAGPPDRHPPLRRGGRFDTGDASPERPTGINYTGGDTLAAAAVTDAAVYGQGHQRWLDNPYRRNSEGPGAVDRRGIGAIDSVRDTALTWNPDKPARQGGQDLLATRSGLWVPSDGERLNGECRRGIAFVALP